MIRRFVIPMVIVGLVWVLSASASQAQEISPGLTIHVVQRGENLFRIAMRYGLATEELAAINGITNANNIAIGQRLLVPSTIVEATPQPTHIVQPGETLRSIAEMYQTDQETLASSNEMTSSSTIYPGQVLVLGATAAPASTITPSPPTAEPDTATVNLSDITPKDIHTVQSGETLFRIATRYNLSVNELATANGISDPTRIFVGQQLLVPGIEATPIALDLPEPITDIRVKPLIFSNGETGSIQIVTSSAVNASARFLERELPVISEENNTLHTMLVGIPRLTEGGVYPLQMTLATPAGATSTYTANIRIRDGVYSSQTITIEDDRLETLAPAVEEYEINLLTQLTSKFQAQRYFNGTLSLPAAAPMNSPYGTLRSYNGGDFDRYHRGADFAGVPGTPVLAAGPGTVVLTDMLNIRGNTTVIDHGWGVFTVYAHQTDILVAIGDTVVSGQQIGTIGSTGRVTGAHLHWEVWVNGVAVNPLQWVSESFP